MQFAQLKFLPLLLLIPVTAAGLWWAHRQRQARLARLGDVALMQRLSASVNQRGRLWKDVLWLIALALVIVSLARPTWGENVQQFDQRGVQVMVALDVSQSMLAEDVRPNRLTRARLEISDMMNRLNGDEVGLALFSGASFIQFPLTSDYNTARSFLDQARPGVISRPGTAIGQAIQTAMTGFDDNLSAQKVIVIFTDGEDTESDPVAIAQQAADKNIIVYTVGFGTNEGVPIPQYDTAGNLTGYKKDANGETVLTRLDDSALRQIADTTNGAYFNANQPGALASLLDDVNALQSASLGERSETRGIERFQIFTLLAFIALFVIELIPDRHATKRDTWLLRLRFSRKGA